MDVTSRSAALPPTLLVAEAPTPSEEIVLRAHSSYVEFVWLPLVGPSGAWALRRLTRLIETEGSTVIDTEAFAVSLEIGHGLGARSTLARVLRRLERFQLVAVTDGRVLARAGVLLAERRLVLPLPPPALAVHDRAAVGGSTEDRSS
jgi:hypothetical protein